MRKLLTAMCLFTLGALSAQEVKNGFLDLRNPGEEFKWTTLDGKWYFFWNQLKDPASSDFSRGTLIDFPELWNNEKETGYASEGYATYQIQVLLDPSKKFAVFTPSVHNAYRFYINDELVSENGSVGTTKETTEPLWRQLTVPVERDVLKDTNVFTLQIANFRYSTGGPVESILFGDRSALMMHRNYIFTLDAILTGALIMGGLFFLGLFLYGRRQKNILYFSLFCLAFSYYVFGSGNYLLQWIFPEIPWLFTVKMEYVSLYLVTILLVKYTYHTYPEDAPGILEKVIIGIILAFLAIAVFLPPSVFTRLHAYYLFFVMGVIVVGLYIFIKAFIKNRPGSRYAIISMSVVVVVIGLKVLDQMEVITLPVFLVPFGYMVFFFLQSVTTSHQVALSWKKAKEEAEASLQVKSDFLSTMSHEIRTPMNAVIGLTHHLLYSHPRKDQKKTLDTLKFSSENLLRLINDILDYNKLESGNLIIEESIFNLRELGDNLVEGFRTTAEEMKTTVIFEFDNDLPVMYIGDSGRLTQVLSNLINNAVKFTKEGRVTLSMKQERRDPERIAVAFCVEDTGIGISKANKDKIFERFNQANTSITRKYGGTGLGLAITKKLLELQSVQIHLESELGRGSRFFFTQNFKIAKGYRKPVVKPSQLVDPLRGKRVLLVEDNDVNIMVAKRFLEKWHCEIGVAENGLEALDAYERSEYDLILMDLQMPEMDGYEATKELRARGASLPIVALTATALTDFDENFKKTGLDDFVVKPFHPDALYQKLIKFLLKEETEA